MDDKITLTCPRCHTAWEKSLSALERYDEIYRGMKGEEKAPEKIAKYRAQCPVCGIYIIATVEED